MMSDNSNSHESFAQESISNKSSERSFGIIFAVFFMILSGWAYYLSNVEWVFYFLGTSVLLLILAIVFPKTLKLPNRIWFQFGLVLHKIISPIVLGFLFLVTVTPTGIIMRLLGKDLLNLRLDRRTKSYWIYRTPPGPEPKSMNDQF